MGFLIDTNVLSELRKGSKMGKNVREWFDAVPPDDIYLSTLVIGEVRNLRVWSSDGAANTASHFLLYRCL